MEFNTDFKKNQTITMFRSQTKTKNPELRRFQCTHVWKKHLDFFRSPPTIYTSYFSLEKMQQFDVIFEIFGRAVFEVAEVAEVKRPRNQKRRKFSNENL